MNEERRDKLAREYAEANIKDLPNALPHEDDACTALTRITVWKGFIAGWNACYAEMLTTRKKDEERSC